ncbi:MAG: hypothetical protein SOW45_04710 [Prevotella sp.]|nr:hypothetical protein [Prevotellaceae bacterium]MDY3104004.1 hypothetical protein [Prevotella sp.]MDY5843760.1 hypothetical protein [Prevotella sp.]
MVILNATPLFIKAKCYDPHHDPVNVENFTRKTGLKRPIKIDHLEKTIGTQGANRMIGGSEKSIFTNKVMVSCPQMHLIGRQDNI